MKNIAQVKADLEEIRFYYRNQVALDAASAGLGECSVMEKVRIYNEVIKTAPTFLYSLYLSLYVMGQSQLTVAMDWEKSSSYIYRLNSRLCKFLSEHIEA